MGLALKPRPPAIRILTQIEADRLDDLYKGLPASTADCITCGGAKTFMWIDDHAQPAEYDCNCNDQRIMHRYFLHSGLRLLYQRFSWQDVHSVEERALDQVREYANNIEPYMRSGHGLILRGASKGTGKTLMASLLFRQILAKGHDGYFTQFNDLLEENSAGWRSEEQRQWFNRRIRNAGILVIDDVGRENEQGSKASVGMVESVFDRVIRSRHDDCKPTIITTNKDEQWWSTRYQSNVMSLLSGTSRVVEVGGPDYRPEWDRTNVKDAISGLARPIVVG